LFFPFFSEIITKDLYIRTVVSNKSLQKTPMKNLNIEKYHPENRFCIKLSRQQIFSFILFLFFISFSKNIFCQNPLSSPPPIDWAAMPGASPQVANFRGMYVSKADILINEIKANGNIYDDIGTTTPKTKELFRYAVDNYFSYIAIYSLAKKNNIDPNDPDPLIGNSSYAPAIRTFLAAAHS
jgi:hypothetical protein